MEVVGGGPGQAVHHNGSSAAGAWGGPWIVPGTPWMTFDDSMMIWVPHEIPRIAYVHVYLAPFCHQGSPETHGLATHEFLLNKGARHDVFP